MTLIEIRRERLPAARHRCSAQRRTSSRSIPRGRPMAPASHRQLDAARRCPSARSRSGVALLSMVRTTVDHSRMEVGLAERIALAAWQTPWRPVQRCRQTLADSDIDRSRAFGPESRGLASIPQAVRARGTGASRRSTRAGATAARATIRPAASDRARGVHQRRIRTGAARRERSRQRAIARRTRTHGPRALAHDRLEMSAPKCGLHGPVQRPALIAGPCLDPRTCRTCRRLHDSAKQRLAHIDAIPVRAIAPRLDVLLRSGCDC